MTSPVTMYRRLASLPSGVLVYLFRFTQATCSKPALNSNTYTLSQEMDTYPLNATYEIFCVPGYIISGETKIVCRRSGKWSADAPACTAAEGTYPWWMLLAGVMLLVLLLACILPRLLSCILKRKKPKGPETDDNQQQHMNDQFTYLDEDVR